ncbi:iron-sulfur cluster assembly scaffold protein [Coleofasciculus sp. E1-EBD-02]|uniref:iron-sulfur cluster assembly scaffold protein n=1 Tax=Coleofasciculus sp. E1-EBD-02 TaxID=3068481 RepID=UPI0032FB638F
MVLGARRCAPTMRIYPSRTSGVCAAFEDIKFERTGCAIAIASADLMADTV